MQRASVVGLGYVGLTMAACLANRRIRTFGVEIDREKLALIRKGTVPFYEPKLREILGRGLRVKRLTVTDNYEEALGNSDVTFVTVGTPSNPDGSINLNQVRDTTASYRGMSREPGRLSFSCYTLNRHTRYHRAGSQTSP